MLASVLTVSSKPIRLCRWALVRTDSPVEGTGFEPSVPLQEKRSKFQRSDPEGRDIELSVSPKDICTSPMISARTARIDDNLGRGTDGSNPPPSTGESAANMAHCRLRGARSVVPGPVDRQALVSKPAKIGGKL